MPHLLSNISRGAFRHISTYQQETLASFAKFGPMFRQLNQFAIHIWRSRPTLDDLCRPDTPIRFRRGSALAMLGRFRSVRPEARLAESNLVGMLNQSYPSYWDSPGPPLSHNLGEACSTLSRFGLTLAGCGPNFARDWTIWSNSDRSRHAVTQTFGLTSRWGASWLGAVCESVSSGYGRREHPHGEFSGISSPPPPRALCGFDI